MELQIEIPYTAEVEAAFPRGGEQVEEEWAPGLKMTLSPPEADAIPTRHLGHDAASADAIAQMVTLVLAYSSNVSAGFIANALSDRLTALRCKLVIIDRVTYKWDGKGRLKEIVKEKVEKRG